MQEKGTEVLYARQRVGENYLLQENMFLEVIKQLQPSRQKKQMKSDATFPITCHLDGNNEVHFPPIS